MAMTDVQVSGMRLNLLDGANKQKINVYGILIVIVDFWYANYLRKLSKSNSLITNQKDTKIYGTRSRCGLTTFAHNSMDYSIFVSRNSGT